MGRRFILTHGDRERYFDLEPGKEALVGRALEAQFFLNETSISRRHCVLRATSTGIEIEDLASTNACFVNGRRVITRMLLSDGAAVQIGKVPFSVQFLPDEEGTAGVAKCGRCGARVDSGELSGGVDGTPVCGKCAEEQWNEHEGRFVKIIESQGFHIQQSLGGDPPMFKVSRQGLGKVFVVKAIACPVSDANRVRSLRDDARVLAELEHEAISPILDVIEDQGVLLLVMAHETGEPLDKFVARRGTFGPRVALEIARSCADAIKHAVDRGVIHREITPRNVIIGPDIPDRVLKEDKPERLRTRLMNFSLVRELNELPKSFTGAGELDRLLYLAPELIREATSVDQRADIFGIGAILLYALSGRSPWGSVTPKELVTAITSGDALEPTVTAAPTSIQPLLELMLSPTASVRPETAEVAIAMLDDAIRVVTSGLATQAGPPPESATGVIQGAFSENELIEFLQLIDLNHKSGDLEIWAGEITGLIVVQEGRLRSARSAGGLEGLAAARRLMGAPTGRFRFTPRVSKERGGLQANLAGLLLDVLRERDEKARP